MSLSRVASSLVLVAGAAASGSTTSTANNTAEIETSGASRFGGLVATFGGPGLSGSLKLTKSRQSWFQAVQWTTSDITVPAQLVRDVCGDFPDEQTFEYQIHDKWGHSSKSYGQGAECEAMWTGDHWDPTAACGPMSGNGACRACDIEGTDYRCKAAGFKASPDAAGDYAYSFLNEDACELGDLSGMNGELEAVVPEDNETESVAIPALASPGWAQMSAPFGQISSESVRGDRIGINCDASGPPAAHATDCDCLKHNGQRSRSDGTVTVFRGEDRSAFHLGGHHLSHLNGKSIVVHCGSTFGDKKGERLFCAKLQ